MCSIIGSFDVERLRELAALNSYRGTHSHSLFVFSPEKDLMYAYRAFDEIDFDKHLYAIRPGDYIIAHQQAPTTESKGMESIHPAEFKGMYLWHNGIIKDHEVKRLQDKYAPFCTWDTRLMLVQYMTTKTFDDLDGTFACALYDDRQLYLFRNEISPLFYNDDGDISSTKFDNSMSLPANKILTFNPGDDNMLTVMSHFKTKENPYYFGG